MTEKIFDTENATFIERPEGLEILGRGGSEPIPLEGSEPWDLLEWLVGKFDMPAKATWYRSLTEDGKVWCESRSLEEVRERSAGKDVTYEKFHIYEVETPWMPMEID